MVVRDDRGGPGSGDAVLVARLSAGDDSALAEVFDRFGPLVHSIARQTTPDDGLADDVTQEVFVTLWQQPGRFEAGRGSLRAFLGVQAQRRAIDVVRRDSRRAGREERHHREDAGTRGSADAGAAVERGEMADAVRRAIGELPPEQRKVVELAYFGGRTHCEIADDLSIPVGTAKSRSGWHTPSSVPSSTDDSWN
jgi:RNA polymerase sigma-70 factor (ECF subfamily)